jgi:hypothetical protein
VIEKAAVFVLDPWRVDRKGSRHDVVLGMDWMRKHGVVLDSKGRKVLLRQRKGRAS